MSAKVVNIAIVVKSDIFARGLEATLADLDHAAVRVDILQPEETLLHASKHRMDLLIADTAAIPELAERIDLGSVHTKVLLVSAREHAGTDLAWARDHGCGFYSARWSLKEFRDMFQRISDCPVSRPGKPACSGCPLPGSLKPRELPLSAREKEIFRRIGEYQGNTYIATELGVSVKTVEAHRANIQNKLGLRSSFDLFEAARDWVKGFW